MTTRRRFISQLATGAGGVAAGAGLLNTKAATAVASMAGNTRLPVSAVGVVRSEKEHVTEIKQDEIRSMVRRAVELAGGFDDLFGDGATVVIKPNMVSYYDMSNNSRNVTPEANGICTDHRVARVVVEMIREINPGGEVYMVEGVGNGTTREAMDWLGFNEEAIPGVDGFVFLDEHSGGWREYDSDKLVSVTLPDGVALYPDASKPNKSPEFYLNKLYYEADAFISLPLLKNHLNTNITGTVKNLGIGGTPANIYGAEPGVCRRDMEIDHGPGNLHKWIHDFYLCRPADFSILDGLQGLSYGPHAMGVNTIEDAQENMRVMLAGRDGVALDAVESYIMNYDPRKVSHLSYLNADEAGAIDPSEIRVSSAFVQDVRKRFRLGYLSDRNAAFSPPEPPVFTVESCRMSGSELKLKLAADENVVKVEVAVGGETLPEDVLGGFDDITLDISSVAGGQDVTVTAYDTYFGSTSVTVPLTTDVKSSEDKRSEAFELMQNTPNPFNPETVISYRLAKAGDVTIRVYDAVGRVVRVLASGWRHAGSYAVRFDGAGCASGTYFCHLECNGKSSIRKMLLIR